MEGGGRLTQKEIGGRTEGRALQVKQMPALLRLLTTRPISLHLSSRPISLQLSGDLVLATAFPAST